VTGILSIFTDLKTLVLFIATFTIIVAVHEFGHFASARLLGMKVLEFAFGFPPRLAGIRRGETEYTINWIPFGGFVRILGQDDFSIHQQGTGDPRSFVSKPWWAQAIVLASGVFMNFVLAFVILTVAFEVGATGPSGIVKIDEVQPGSPAEVAGFKPGDIVRAVDGTAVHTSQAVVNVVTRAAERGRDVSIELERNGAPLPPMTVTPRANPPAGQGPLGIRLNDQMPVSVPLPQAASQSKGLITDVVGQIIALPGQLLAQRATPDGNAPVVGGPVEIFRVTGDVAKFGTPGDLLKLVGILSVNLGVINIIPFPGLDGGRLFFVLLGALLRRRLSPQVEAVIHAVGFVLLLGLLVIVSISDIRRAIGG
jgi:regulator of sigma E protease